MDAVVEVVDGVDVSALIVVVWSILGLILVLD